MPPRPVLAAVLLAALAGLVLSAWVVLGGGRGAQPEVPDAPSHAAAGPADQRAVAAALAASDPDSAAAAALRACRDSGARKTTCYESILVPRVSSAGVREAMETLARIGAADRDVQRDGHVYAHAIGIEAYRRDPDVGRTFGRCTELYQSGCYHGVIQARFEDVAARHGAGITAGDVNALCRSYRQSGDQWLLFQCVHGMGHGLTMFHDHDLRLALADCDLLTDDWDRHACYGGAFMENIVNQVAPHHAHPAAGEAAAGGEPHGAHEAPASPAFKAMDPTDPLYPCSALEDRYLVDCYQMQTSIILFFNGGDIAGAARTCDTARADMRPWCYQSLGRDISSYTLQDPAESIRMCSLGDRAYQPWCYVGLVKNFVDLTARTDEGFAFCRQVPGRGNRLKCYEALGEQVTVLTPDSTRRAELCARSEPEYLDACRYGARLTARRPEALPSAEGRMKS